MHLHILFLKYICYKLSFFFPFRIYLLQVIPFSFSGKNREEWNFDPPAQLCEHIIDQLWYEEKII